jgi:Peptidase family S41
MRRQFAGLFFAAILLVHPHSILSQATKPAPYNPDAQISRAKLQADFLAFRKSLEEAQASLYRYADKRVMERNFDAAFASINRDMTEREFYALLTSILSRIEDGHTNAYVTRDFRNYLNQSAKMFPLKLRFIGGRAYVLTSPQPSVAAGVELLSINGRPLSRITRQLFRHLTADGDIETGKFWKLNEQFSLYYYLFIEQPAKFQIATYDRSKKQRKRYEVPALTQKEQSELLKEKNESAPKVDKKPLRLEPLAGPRTALLTIETFDDGAIEKAGQNFPQFLKSSFQEILERNTRDLIIDLRGNDGGADFGPLLFSYLTGTQFRFVDRIEAATAKPAFILNYTQVGPDFLKRLAESLRPNGKGRYIVKPESEPTLGWQQPQAVNYRNRVWFITNGETFSATAMFCDIARSQRRGVFVGEETGGDYFGNSAGEFVVITLPETKIKFIVALEEYWMAVSPGPKPGRGVVPDYFVQPTISDLLKGSDAELNFILRAIEKRRMRK